MMWALLVVTSLNATPQISWHIDQETCLLARERIEAPVESATCIPYYIPLLRRINGEIL
jgi:hypothetical protein